MTKFEAIMLTLKHWNKIKTGIIESMENSDNSVRIFYLKRQTYSQLCNRIPKIIYYVSSTCFMCDYHKQLPMRSQNCADCIDWGGNFGCTDSACTDYGSSYYQWTNATNLHPKKQLAATQKVIDTICLAAKKELIKQTTIVCRKLNQIQLL